MNIKYTDFNPDDTKRISVFRIISLRKLLDFIETAELYMSRLDCFEDNLELADPLTMMNILFISEKEPSNTAFKEAYSKEERDNMQGFNIQTLKYIQDKLPQEQRYYFANCWHLSNHESMGMWNSYAKDGFALAFDFTYFVDLVKKRLNSDNFSMPPHHFYLGKTQYWDAHHFPQDYLPDDTFRGFLKHKCFEYEQEYRLMAVRFEDRNGKGIRFKLADAIEDLNFDIIANPRMSPKDFNMYSKLVNKYNSKLMLRKSNLSRLMQFKNLKLT